MRSKSKETANPKTTFCQSFPWTIAIQWFDLTGMYKYGDGERVARIELDTNGTMGHYEGFLVTVFNKREGKIDSKFFRFNDYLDGTQRADNRPDCASNFMVIGHTGWSWFIAVPKDTKPVVRAIEQYLKVFQ